MSLKVKLIHNNYTKSCCACLPKSNEKWSLHYEEFFIGFTNTIQSIGFQDSDKVHINTRCGKFMCIMKYNSFRFCSHVALYVDNKETGNKWVYKFFSGNLTFPNLSSDSWAFVYISQKVAFSFGISKSMKIINS